MLTRGSRRGLVRGAVVVIASDGLERGDPAELGREMERLSRVARSVLWVSPLSGKKGYRPVQGGIAAIVPHVDGLVDGHTLEAFQLVLDRIARS